MWLLNVATLALKHFAFEAGVPPYAIASHRWLDDEITFQEVLEKRNLTSAGYNKVQGFCTFVQHYCPDLHWLWIDTCCINRSSHLDLREAVMSMYTWYAYASVCIVYLHDVPGQRTGVSAHATDPTSSIWFERGLTMLELIAPRHVMFADSVWDLIGYKDDEHITSLITARMGIATDVLLNVTADRGTEQDTISEESKNVTGATLNGEHKSATKGFQDEVPSKIESRTKESSEKSQTKPSRPPQAPILTMSTRSAIRPRTDIDRQPNSKRRGSWCRRAGEGSGDEEQASVSKGFPCPFIIYGCPSTFGIKNEWKRHVHTQHMRLVYWRCVQCSEINDGRRPNDFNRRDLFVQHVRRMHPFSPATSPAKKLEKVTKGNDAEEEYLAEEATRCYRQLRRAPESSRCLLCDHHFRGPNSWEQRMEHVGRHFEDIKKSAQSTAPLNPREWHLDQDLEQYLLGERIIELQGKRPVLAEGS